MELVIPDDESIRKIENAYPDASPAEKWRLVQEEARRKMNADSKQPTEHFKTAKLSA